MTDKELYLSICAAQRAIKKLKPHLNKRGDWAFSFDCEDGDILVIELLDFHDSLCESIRNCREELKPQCTNKTIVDRRFLTEEKILQDIRRRVHWRYLFGMTKVEVKSDFTWRMLGTNNYLYSKSRFVTEAKRVSKVGDIVVYRVKYVSIPSKGDQYHYGWLACNRSGYSLCKTLSSAISGVKAQIKRKVAKALV